MTDKLPAAYVEDMRAIRGVTAFSRHAEGLLTAYTETVGSLRGATEFNAPAPRATWEPIEARARALRHELLDRIENERRHALATQDYHECRGAVRALRLVLRALRGLPQTHREVRGELRFWVAAAQRAKQVMRSTQNA